MAWQGIVQLVALVVALVLTVPRLGRYFADVYGVRDDGSAPGDRMFKPVERAIYRICGVDETKRQRWNAYALSMLAFSLVSLLALYGLQRAQGLLPFNPTNRTSVNPWGSFNVAVSFVTNTNWQWYSGEVTMSHLTQMVGLTVQNFVSASAGMAVAIAMIRGIGGLDTKRLDTKRLDARTLDTKTLGNFWVDLTRTMVRILLPLAFVTALLLVSQGVVQNLHGFSRASTVDQSVSVTEQAIPGGPVASQVAIKQLGSNGGGFYNANSAHPFENPNGWSNFIELFLILAISFALAVTFGHLVKDRRQGRVLMAAMFLVWLSFALFTVFAEQSGNPRLTALGVDQSISSTQTGGNMEGKEVRFGPPTCGVWAASTTGTSNGSVNCMHDSFTPLGGLAPLAHMMLGEISPGGVGVGMMSILVYALLAVFVAGLMVGRTPEYLGKKIQVAEMKLVVLFTLATPIALLGFAAPSVLIDSGTALQPGAHGLSVVLYNFGSTANNNGSAFASMGAGTQWYTVTQGVSMLIGRFFLIIPALAIAGSLAGKPRVPVTAGTFPTHTAQFMGLLIGVIVIVTGLEFLPALALGPVVEHLRL